MTWDADARSSNPVRTIKRAAGVVIGIFLFFVVGYAFFNTIMWVDAGEIVTIQSLGGSLNVVANPGPTFLAWGSPTHYPRRQQVAFFCDGKRDAAGKCSGTDTSIQVRFNDGGHAWVSGVVSWEMPLVPDSVIKLHKEFRSIETIDRQLVQPAINKAFYQTSPLMSSTESYASRRTEFLQIFEDQLRNGTYQTRTVSVREADPVTGMEKTVSKVELIMDANGTPKRNEDAAFKLYGISILPATINAIDYDSEVENQIKAQRDAILAVQAAQANARRAEQDALTAKSQGDVRIAQARAEQEAIKASEVTQAEKQKAVAVLGAEQEKDVAKLNQEAAEYTKQQNILLGQGEAERKKLVMTADGALEQKLKAYVEINQFYANAIAQHQGSWVPNIVMAGGGAGANNASANGAQMLMEMFTAKTAKDLALDLSLPNAQQPRR